MTKTAAAGAGMTSSSSEPCFWRALISFLSTFLLFYFQWKPARQDAFLPCLQDLEASIPCRLGLMVSCACNASLQLPAIFFNPCRVFNLAATILARLHEKVCLRFPMENHINQKQEAIYPSPPDGLFWLGSAIEMAPSSRMSAFFLRLSFR